ncbi:MAG: hypothetical protein ABIV43_03730 [Candidatus Saccharimonadales bacterium]
MIDKLDTWHKTKLGYASFAVLELSLGYLFASLSIDKGNLWYYLLTLLFLIGATQNVFKLAGAARGR